MLRQLKSFSVPLIFKTLFNTGKPIFSFSRRAKNSQLILHSPEQIENMITKRNIKLELKD